MILIKLILLIFNFNFLKCQLYFATTPNPYGNSYQNSYNQFGQYLNPTNNYNQYDSNNYQYNSQYSTSNYQAYGNQYSNFNGYSAINSIVGNSNCACVTSGYCNRSGGSPINGSTLMDIRVLNGNSYTSSIINQIYTTPVSTGITVPTSSQSYCQTGLELCCTNYGHTCGVRYPPVQGTTTTVANQAPYGSYPWFALIFQQNSYNYVASGVLIDQRHVLTVAHKVSSYASNPYSLKVRLGEWTIGGSKPINSLEFSVTRIFVHYAYNSQSLANSISLVRVNPDVPLGQTPTITNACLSSTQFTSGNCWIAGYGQNTVGGSSTIQPTMIHVEVPLVDQVTCQNQLRTTRLGSGYILDTVSFLCAGGMTGKDACMGDGGSGLMCHSNGQWYVVGLVAWGIGCGSPNIPGIYMNVNSYINWIQSTTIQQ